MILIEDFLKLHDFSINDYGGAVGIRDIGLLESAIPRPFQTFDGEDLYKTSIKKAAALGKSLIINHPFIDGNKRTGMLGMFTLLLEYDLIVKASEQAAYDFTIQISTGEIKFNEIVLWLKNNTEAV